MHKVIASIKRDTITKISRTVLSEYPFLRSLCDIWSVPPVIGDLPDCNLEITTVVKSNSGIVKNKITGWIWNTHELSIFLFHVNRTLIILNSILKTDFQSHPCKVLLSVN